MNKNTNARFRLLHTTDLHANVLGFDYFRDKPRKSGALSQLSTLIQAERLQGPCLLFDSGDFLQGSPLSDAAAHAEDSALRQPVIDAMNHVGYDAITLGNHDLDFGIDVLSEALAKARFPIVSCNLELPAPLAAQIKSFVILERDIGAAEPLRIGVTGCLPADTLEGSVGFDPAIRCVKLAPALRQAVREMKAKGAELIVVLAHCGRCSDLPDAETITSAIAGVEGVDVVLGGHTHEVYPHGANPDDKLAPAVALSGAFGAHLGLVEVRQSGAGYVARACLPLAAHAAEEDLALCAALQPAHRAARAFLAQQIGESQSPIRSHYSLVGKEPSLSLIGAAFEEALRSELSARGFDPALPVLSLVAPARTGQRGGAENYVNIPAGPLRLRDIALLYGFTDTLCALEVSGRDIRDLLEVSAALFNHVPTGAQDAPLLCPDVPGYRFDVIPQLTYEINLATPPLFDPKTKTLAASGTRRVRNILYRGAPLEDDRHFILAASSYRARGRWARDEAGNCRRPEMLFDTAVQCRSLLSNYVAKNSPLLLPPEGNWRFATQPATTVAFETAAEALSYLTDDMQDTGERRDGFATLSLSLCTPANSDRQVALPAKRKDA